MTTAANYNEVTVAGTSWLRCARVVVQNEREGQVYVLFDEERIINIDGAQQIAQPVGTLRVDFDPGRTIELIDPETNLPTGDTISHAAIYQILYSAYLSAAMARDAAE